MNQTGLPARCRNPACGFVFEVGGLIGGTGSTIELVGVRTSCPKCGYMADIGTGRYQLQDDVLTLIDGPTLTRRMLDQLSSIAQAAKAGLSDAEEILAEVAEVSPELAAKIRNRGLTTFAIILLLIWLIKSVSFEVKVDLNRLIDQAMGVAAESNDPKVLESDPQQDLRQRSEPSRSTWADQQTTPMSRQVRRQLERRSRKT